MNEGTPTLVHEIKRGVVELEVRKRLDSLRADTVRVSR